MIVMELTGQAEIGTDQALTDGGDQFFEGISLVAEAFAEGPLEPRLAT